MPLTPTDVANKQFAIKMRGYAVDEVDVFLEEVETELARLLREGRLRHDETIVDGLERMPDALRALLAGAHRGKLLVRVADDA